MSAALGRALEARRAAEVWIERVLAADYAKGNPVEWRFNGKVQRGKVVRLCYGDRLEVLNIDTGKQLFIHAHNIVEAQRR